MAKAPTRPMRDTLAYRLAEYADALTFEALPEAVVHETRRRVLDSLGCALGAMDSEPARIMRTLAAGVIPWGKRGATVWGTDIETTPEWAAMANGTLVRYLDFNDTYLSQEPAHPSDNIPALWAVAEAEGRTGRELITAIALAYEIQCRLCDAASIRAQGWDHVTYGAFSVALGVGKLLGLSLEQLVHAQALSANPHVAMRQTRVGELSHWKGCAFANAARNAVFAATLARAGLTGPSEIFEGEMAFSAQVSRTPIELPVLGGVDGAPWMMPETYIKHFPAEYHSQSAIEAALALRQQIPDVGAIAEIIIESFDAAVDIIAGFPEHWAPTSRETADHSMPYCVAAALMDGDITLNTFSPARIQDPALRALIQTVAVHRNAEMTAGYPDGIPNQLTVVLKDGRRLTETVRYPLGHARNPMSDADVARKFRGLASRWLPEEEQARIISAVYQLDGSLPALLPVLTEENE